MNLTGCLAFADRTVIQGTGFGAQGIAIGEICFNTSMTGYQEILTDPSYSQQVVLFTFPHIGNVGTNEIDRQSKTSLVQGVVVREMPTEPSSWRSQESLIAWMQRNDKIGLAEVDTRFLTRKIRQDGMQNVAIAHDPTGNHDPEDLVTRAKSFAGIAGMELAMKIRR